MCIYIYIVNDTILVDEIKHGVNVKLEVRRDALESNCFWQSMTKTKYMKCKFSKRRNKDEDMCNEKVKMNVLCNSKKYFVKILGNHFTGEQITKNYN